MKQHPRSKAKYRPNLATFETRQQFKRSLKNWLFACAYGTKCVRHEVRLIDVD